MDRQILKQFASYGSVNKQDVDLLLQLAQEQQQQNWSSKQTWIGEKHTNHKEHQKKQPSLPQAVISADKHLMMHGQTPYVLPPHLLPQFSLANGLQAPNANGQSKDALDCELRCFICGTTCSSLLDFNQHIKQHLPVISEAEKNCSSVNEQKSDDRNRFHAKSWSDSSSLSSDVDSTPPQFPIPVPNFSLFNESTTTSSSSDKEARGSDGLSPFAMNLPINPSLLSSLPGAFGLLNPFLSYQNLINTKGIPGALPGMNVNPYGYLPYVGFPTTPAASLPSLPGRFPYFPGLPLGLPTSTAQDPASSSNETKSKNSNSHRNETNHVVTEASDVTNSSFPTTTDSLQRRFSVPMMPLNNEFRVPHPYTRIRKPSHNAQSHDEKTESECVADHRAAQVGNKKRSSANDKSANHLNAKSIEQHISKLISNNEKLLTNPELERVKPRRVFRRNSLDPASLSSYASGMVKYNSREVAYYREASKKPRRMLSESENSYTQSSTDPKQLDPHDTYSSALSLAEYNKMIQLTRAPFTGSEEQRYPSSSADDKLAEKFSQAPETSNESSKPAHGRENLPGKREYPQAYPHSNKKSRRSSFFECNDCGVRYRKEENYKIHKKIYCKFKKTNSLFHTKENHRRHSELLEVPTCESGHSQQLDRHAQRLVPHFELTRPVTSRSLVLPTDMGRSAAPLKSTRPDLCRTKSAEASLETTLIHDNKWKLANTSLPVPSHPTMQRLSSDSATENCNASQPCSEAGSGVTSSMPDNKLPPNKRHLMRHHFEQESDSTPSPHFHRASPDEKLMTTLSSSNIDAKPTQPSEIHCENKCDDSLIPRSNYKLLVHQISLRNLQDIGFMGDLSSSPLQNKSVWCWEQMQNLKHDKMQDLSCDDSTLHPATQGMPTSVRKFSVPSRLFPSNPTATPDHANLEKTDSDNFHALQNQGNVAVSHDKESQHSKAVSSAISDQSTSGVDLQPPSVKEFLSRTQSVEDTTIPSTSDSRVIKTSDGIKETSCSEENANLLETGAAIRRERSVVLYPHIEPVLESHTQASFCCIVSPQPTCIEATKSKDTNDSQLSMYSDWTASEPFLIPKDLTIGDILTGWCRCRAPCEQGMVTCQCKKNEMLVTDNKDYEKNSKQSAEESEKEAKSNEASCEKLSCPRLLEPYKQAKMTDFKPNYIFASCQHKNSSNGFPYAMLPDFVSSFDHDSAKSSSGDVTDNISLTDGRISMEEDGTTSAPRESDAADASGEFVGRVKKLRSRKDRSSTSPREKRKAAGGVPISPTTVMAVHQDGVCCDVTEDNSSGCALCSMKAEKAGLLSDSTARRDGGKSPQLPTMTFTQASATTSPAVTEAVLDRTRETSGNTQHWVSDPSQMGAELTKHPSPPVSDGSGSEEASHNRLPSVSENGTGSGDMNKIVGAEPSAPVIGTSLAEVVSEVMRSAAMQSKIHNKRRQLLAGSRALYLRGNDEESPALKRRNVRSTSQPTRLEDDSTCNSSRTLCDNSASHSSGEGFGSSLPEQRRTNGSKAKRAATPDPSSFSDKNNNKRFTNYDDTSLSEPGLHHEVDSSAIDDDDNGVRYDTAKTDGRPRSPGSSIAARPFRCSECKIAFRIGGHLSKHLRSKGHIVAVQKKTLNRLKMSQRISGTVEVDLPNTEPPETDRAQPVHKGNGSVSDPEVSELLSGSDVLARAQVKALLEGSEEYACVPTTYPESPRLVEEVHENVLVNYSDPRPYKCIACKVAFRFQGHLDRHFRSNSHLIAIGHYEQTPGASNDSSFVEQVPTSLTGQSHPINLLEGSRDVCPAEEFGALNQAEQLCSNGATKKHLESVTESSSGEVLENSKSLECAKKWSTLPNGLVSSRDARHLESSTPETSKQSRSDASPNNSQLNGGTERQQNLLNHEHIAPKPPLPPCQVSCT